MFGLFNNTKRIKALEAENNALHAELRHETKAADDANELADIVIKILGFFKDDIRNAGHGHALVMRMDEILAEKRRAMAYQAANEAAASVARKVMERINVQLPVDTGAPECGWMMDYEDRIVVSEHPFRGYNQSIPAKATIDDKIWDDLVISIPRLLHADRMKPVAYDLDDDTVQFSDGTHWSGHFYVNFKDGGR